MAETVRLLNLQQNLSAATSVDNGTLIRVFNSGSDNTLVTLRSGSTVLATTTIAAGEIVYIKKYAAETLQSDGTATVVNSVSH